MKKNGKFLGKVMLYSAILLTLPFLVSLGGVFAGAGILVGGVGGTVLGLSGFALSPLYGAIFVAVGLAGPAAWAALG